MMSSTNSPVRYVIVRRDRFIVSALGGMQRLQWLVSFSDDPASITRGTWTVCGGGHDKSVPTPGNVFCRSMHIIHHHPLIIKK